MFGLPTCVLYLNMTERILVVFSTTFYNMLQAPM